MICAFVSRATGVEEEWRLDYSDNLFLNQPFPNPTISRVQIVYGLPNSSQVSLKVYDLSGRLIRTLVDRKEEAGVRQVFWDGRDQSGQDLPSGIYFYRLSSQGLNEFISNTVTKKSVILR